MATSDVNSGVGKFGKAHLAGWIPDKEGANAPRLFEPTTSTAADLQQMLTAGDIISVEILSQYYSQILAYNGYLKAVYQLTPSALKRARELDALRAQGKVLGPLHGIPVLLKVLKSLVLDARACLPLSRTS